MTRRPALPVRRSAVPATVLGLFTVGASAALAPSPALADALPNDKVAEPAVMAGPNDLDYVKKLHAQVHKRWTDNFLQLISQNLKLSDPLNDPTRVAEADVVISGDGRLLSVTLTKRSGFAGFDDAIPEIVKDSSPFPKPPVNVRSDDDNLHVHWTFARDERRCSGLAIIHVDDPLDVAIPKLMKGGRRDEIVGRVVAARASGLPAEPSVSSLAVEWLRGSAKQPWVTTKIAAALAERDDADAIAWLKGAVKKPDQAKAAGAALAAKKIPVCPLVKADLEGGNATAALTAAQALATAGEAACAPGLVGVLTNPKSKTDARVAAIIALGPIDDDGAKAALATAVKDDNAAVRGAASLAQIRPGAGRAKMLGMVHLVKDPAMEVRAAGSAGVVRAGGDSDFDDLYMLFRDTDARPALAVLAELDRVPSDEATKMIAKLMRRPLPAVQKAAAQLLIKRHAKAMFPAFKSFLEPPAADADLRGMAFVAADDAQLAAKADDPKLGVWVYRALLARGERDRAADWLLAHAPAMTPAAQADAMVDWLASAESHAVAAKGKR
ncbi:MAG TPA: TonB C-terminal domain-containing protein [Polyangia bacterium]|nr:TonB C-terminal domain-containing protein [Polyangia bacterium]